MLQTGVKKIELENCWLTTELDFGGLADGWMELKPDLRTT
jgi:hypothetical protein